MVSKTPVVPPFRSEDFERFFEVVGWSYLFASFYAESYRNLGILVVDRAGHMSVLLSKIGTADTRNRGLSLFFERVAFREYEESFGEFLRTADTFFRKILNESTDAERSGKFFDAVLRFLDFYRYTEFFYTDTAYSSMEKAELSRMEELSWNLPRLERLKTEGRKLLIRIFNGSSSYLQKFVSGVAAKLGISRNDVELLGFREIVESLACGRSIGISSELRTKDYAIASFSAGTRFLKGGEFDEAFTCFFDDVLVDSVVGTVASRGKAEGKARVLPADFHTFDRLSALIDEMEAGEILIAETTSPDLILACRKASAIVTNQWGLGSHAAIVSRELGIPCIVGTKNATKVFGTGDTVSVDAENGTVTLIQKAH